MFNDPNIKLYVLGIVGAIASISLIILLIIFWRKNKPNKGSQIMSSMEFAALDEKQETSLSSATEQPKGVVFDQNAQSLTTPVLKVAFEQQGAAPKRVIERPIISISYRRMDSADVAGRIYDRLVNHFGEESIFKDVDSIPPGADFRAFLDEMVGKCHIFLVVIGRRWVQVANQKGKPRLDDPRDFVRIEIESALKREIPVIPLRVRGAEMPVEEQLPSEIKDLTYRNAIQIRSDPDFHKDMDRLIASIMHYTNG